ETPLYLGPGHRPFVPANGPGLDNLGRAQNMTLDRLADRRELLRSLDGLRRDLDARGELASMDAFTGRALDMITSSRPRPPFGISREPLHVREQYGLVADMPTYNANYYVLSKFLLARRLVEAGVPVVTLEAFGEWDTHGDNFNGLRRMLPVIDRGVSALVEDLNQRGLGQDVAVVMWGEFGRAPRITMYNHTPPARHPRAPATAPLSAGGVLKGAKSTGKPAPRPDRPRAPPTPPHPALPTLYQAPAIDPAMTVNDHRGRPMFLLDHRERIEE